MFVLRNRAWSCGITPELGGSVTWLRCEGKDVLRPAPNGLDNVLDTAIFPLVPFANRIGHGKLNYAGQCFELDPDPAAFPHAHHGHGWRGAWNVEEVSGHRAVLTFEHGGDKGWIWPYRVRQELEVLDDGLAIGLSLTNLHQQTAMPAGAGIHPYFNRNRTTRIWAQAGRIWVNASDGLAIEEHADTAFDADRPVEVNSLVGCDNFYASSRPVLIDLGDRRLLVGGDGMAGFHLYVPPEEAYFCVEPVSHAPNAFGRGDIGDLDIVRPFATRNWRWTLLDRTQQP